MINERAIILRTIKCGESDLVVHALNGEGCRINLMAKGALRSRRRFGGGLLEPLNYVRIIYRSRVAIDEQESLHWLEEVQLLRDFRGLRDEFDRLELGIYLLQLVAKVSKEGTLDNRGLFDLLGNSLQTLEKSSHIKYLKLLFELKLLHQQGVLDQRSHGASLVAMAIRDHEQINLSEDHYNQTKQETQTLLDAYL